MGGASDEDFGVDRLLYLRMLQETTINNRLPLRLAGEAERGSVWGWYSGDRPR